MRAGSSCALVHSTQTHGTQPHARFTRASSTRTCSAHAHSHASQHAPPRVTSHPPRAICHLLDHLRCALRSCSCLTPPSCYCFLSISLLLPFLLHTSYFHIFLCCASAVLCDAFMCALCLPTPGTLLVRSVASLQLPIASLEARRRYSSASLFPLLSRTNDQIFARSLAPSPRSTIPL